ncbi:uncharacterized protein LOC124927986 isoform X2 [Impatiens glandulifera]|nr:uncharacterized protein LOC124927986 isoform X2 [Impatiens glandulifera]
MTTKDETVLYAPIPSPDIHSDHQNYVVLPVYRRRRPPLTDNCSLYLRRGIGLSASVLLCAAVVWILFPSDPYLSLVRLRLNQIKVRSSPHISLDLSLSLTLRVRNRDLFSLDYSSLDVSIGYRGRQLGIVTSDGGHVKARASSYVNATLVLDGFEVIHDAFYLIEDLARGSIPFDSISEVKGTVGLFFLKIPIKAKVSCEVCVNTSSQTIVRQDCYPE